MYSQGQARAAGSAFWHYSLSSCSGRKQQVLVTPCTAFFAPPCLVSVSAVPCWNAPLQHPGTSCPGVVLVWSKTPRSCRKKKTSFALSYSGTRGTCLSQGGPVNLCCAPELFLWSLAVMDNLIYCVQPNRTMGNGFKFKKA